MVSERYKTGEYPEFGDIVRGIPNNATKTVAGLVTAAYDDTIRVAFYRPGSDGSGDVSSVYGTARHFELLARNVEG